MTRDLKGDFKVSSLKNSGTARVASHGGVLRMRRGGEGGHGGLGGGEVQPLSDGVYHLQRNHPPQLSQGDQSQTLVSSMLFICFCLYMFNVRSLTSVVLTLTCTHL